MSELGPPVLAAPGLCLYPAIPYYYATAAAAAASWCI